MEPTENPFANFDPAVLATIKDSLADRQENLTDLVTQGFADLAHADEHDLRTLAQHVETLAQVVADKVAPAYAEQANIDAPEQDENKTLIDAAAVFNREKAAA